MSRPGARPRQMRDGRGHLPATGSRAAVLIPFRDPLGLGLEETGNALDPEASALLAGARIVVMVALASGSSQRAAPLAPVGGRLPGAFAATSHVKWTPLFGHRGRQSIARRIVVS